MKVLLVFTLLLELTVQAETIECKVSRDKEAFLEAVPVYVYINPIWANDAGVLLNADTEESAFNSLKVVAFISKTCFRKYGRKYGY